MSFWDKLDPTSSDFLGMGPKIGRIMAGLQFGAAPEFFRTDPFATTPGTTTNKVFRGIGGAIPGAIGGYVTGGPVGAATGAVAGGTLAGTGTTDSTTLSGFGENFGAGVGSGGLTHIPSMMGSGAPTAPGAAGSSPVHNSLQMMRGMPMGGGQQQPPQQDQQSRLQQLYQMYPMLRPHFGGQYGA